MSFNDAIVSCLPLALDVATVAVLDSVRERIRRMGLIETIFEIVNSFVSLNWATNEPRRAFRPSRIYCDKTFALAQAMRSSVRCDVVQCREWRAKRGFNMKIGLNFLHLTSVEQLHIIGDAGAEPSLDSHALMAFYDANWLRSTNLLLFGSRQYFSNAVWALIKQ